jgi:protein involved in polysaccharide export with SLBB domain
VAACAVLSLVLATSSRAQQTFAPQAEGQPQVQIDTGDQNGASSERTAAAGTEETSGLASLARNLLQLPGAVDPDIYRLGPGDLLLLQLWGRVSRSLPLEIGPEGMVLVPGAGPVRVDGLTLSRARQMLLDRMATQFKGVHMDLRLARPRTFIVYMTGQVRAPGPVAATGTSRVADVLRPDVLLEDASRRAIEVLHRDGSRELADLDLFHRIGDASGNLWLRDGDVLNVPVATEFVFAEGAVARPERIELGARDSLLNLLRLAGDPIPAADAARVLLVHFRMPFQPESLWLTLDDIYSRRNNPRLHDGDRLYVYFVPQYHLQHEATLLGEVGRPGVYPIAEGMTRLSHLVQAAGGFLNSADLSAIRVHRRNVGTGEKDPELDRLLRLSRNDLTATEYVVLRTRLAGLREDYRVDWRRLTAGNELDLLMRNGDLVQVDRLVSSIRVDGEVKRPGVLNYIKGQRIDDYVKQVGGYTGRAWRGKVRVTRAVTGQTILARNVQTLNPGDFVWVPEKPDVTIWQQTRDVLTGLAEVATIIIAIRSVR